MSDKFHIFVLGPRSTDRNRILRVLGHLQGPGEWDGDPPAIETVEAFEYHADLRHRVAQLLGSAGGDTPGEQPAKEDAR